MNRILSTFTAVAAVAPLALIATLATACSAAPDPAGEPVETNAGRIINGVASGPDDDFTVAIYQTDASGAVMGACTGSLVAENLVLTARHCVATMPASQGIRCAGTGATISGAKVGANLDPARLAIATGSTRSINPVNGIPSNVVAHGAKIYTPPGNTLCNSDLAMIQLDTPLVGAMLVPLRLDAPPLHNERITSIGWGVVSNTIDFPTTRQRRANVLVQTVGPIGGSGDGIGPNEFQVGESICEGDSGGPAFAQSTSAVIGVVSRGGNGQPSSQTTPAASCTGTQASNLYTRVDGWKDWILSCFADSGATAWLEGQPDPRLTPKGNFGDACSGPENCVSALCIGFGAGTQCTQTCDAGSPCPAGYSCTAAGGQSLCAPSSATSSKGGCSVAPKNADASSGVFALSAAVVGLALAGAARRSRRRPQA
jgi:MYXO-CTERM domain-containing protein